MKISVVVKPNCKKPGIDALSDTNWVVRVRESAVEGKANKAIIESISEKTGFPKSRIKIIRGEKSRQKIIEII
ncbi:MAG: DUF167 domain-containing protein [Leptospira sp.]|nr:DUF167 domain-containing protein [Leptospira sp.]